MLGLLSDSCPRDLFPTAQFDLFQLSNFQTPPWDEGVSLYLYRIAPNTSRRNLPPTTGPDGTRFRPPIPLDLFYVASAWAPTAIKQQHLLAWAIRTFEDVPILPTNLLNNYSKKPDIFRPDETVELTLDSLTLQDWNNLWTTTKTTPPLSVGYIARMLHLESSTPMTELPLVQTRDFGIGKN